MNCTYCQKECKHKNALAQHEIRCKSNSNKIIVNSNFVKYNENIKSGIITKDYSNQYTKAEKLGIDKPSISEETRQKLSNAGKGKKHTPESIENIKLAMQRVVREKPESYSASNINGRTKKILYNGILLDGLWEVLFAEWCDINNIKWLRPINGFEYEWNGKRIYYPDFFLPEYELYIEIKGYERERDLSKWAVVPNLRVIKQHEIKKIKEGIFIL